VPSFNTEYPPGYATDILNAFKEELEGEDIDTSGLSNAELAQKWISRQVRRAVVAYRRRTNAVVTAAVTAAQVALADKEAAAATLLAARRTAEQDDVTQVETDFDTFI